LKNPRTWIFPGTSSLKLVTDEWRTHPAREVAAGRFKLDHLGAGVGELHRAEGAAE
jgi:hypothetical protein